MSPRRTVIIEMVLIVHRQTIDEALIAPRKEGSEDSRCGLWSMAEKCAQNLEPWVPLLAIVLLAPRQSVQSPVLCGPCGRELCSGKRDKSHKPILPKLQLLRPEKPRSTLGARPTTS